MIQTMPELKFNYICSQKQELRISSVMCYKRLINTFLLILISLGISYSQLNPPPVTFQHVSLKEGLSQSTVYDIKQDQFGYIWIATADGLNRYDGYKFVVYRHNPDDSLSLPSNTVNSILLDKNNDMWIGTGLGLAKYIHARNSFKSFYLSKKGLKMRVLSIERWTENKYVIATNIGLYMFSEEHGFRELNFPPHDYSS